MGTDCYLYIFPKGKPAESHDCARLVYFLELYSVLGIKSPYRERVTARRMMSALEDLPDLPDGESRGLTHWRDKAWGSLKSAIDDHGQDVPVMICDEHFDPEDWTENIVLLTDSAVIS